jgi:Autophagy protein Apg6.
MYRMIMAIEESTSQLNAEASAYDAAVQLEKDKHRRLLRALNIKGSIDGECVGDDDTVASGNTAVSFLDDYQASSEYILKKTFEAFEYEIQKLTETHTLHLAEMNNLDELFREQIILTKELSQQEDDILREINGLELDSKVFQDIHGTLTRQCQEAEVEDYLLRNVRMHSTLFDIKLDERGLRYPLINNLRLTHHPKGVSWLEINAAWSQASQLVMFVGSTTKFQSKDLRIVPLASCAKIIDLSHGDKKIVKHLGVDFESNARKTHETEHIIPSLRAFLALIYEMSVHMLKEQSKLDPIPYEMGPFVIGPHDVRKLDEKDDVGWRDAIHCMAYNMKWMAQNACKFLPPVS